MTTLYGHDKAGETWKLVESDDPGYIDLYQFTSPTWTKWSEVHESDITSILDQLGIDLDRWYNHQQ